jgi:hypothetical protein
VDSRLAHDDHPSVISASFLILLSRLHELVDFLVWALVQSFKRDFFVDKREYRLKLELDLMAVPWERQTKLHDRDIP